MSGIKARLDAILSSLGVSLGDISQALRDKGSDVSAGLRVSQVAGMIRSISGSSSAVPEWLPVPVNARVLGNPVDCGELSSGLSVAVEHGSEGLSGTVFPPVEIDIRGMCLTADLPSA